MTTVLPIVLIYIIACCVFSFIDAAHWRFYPKVFQSCNEDVVIVASDIQVVYSDHGRKWILKWVFTVHEDTNTARITMDAWKDGNPPMKWLTWNLGDMCNQIQKGNKWIDPLYAPGQFPKSCIHKKGVYNMTNIDSENITGVLLGETSLYRGTFIYRLQSYSDKNTLIFCVRSYGLLKMVQR